MRKYKGKKPVREIISDAREKGYMVHSREYKQGSDWLRLFKDGRQFLVNTFNGCFMVSIGNELIATETSQELDNEPWYVELLDLIYVPISEKIGG